MLLIGILLDGTEEDIITKLIDMRKLTTQQKKLYEEIKSFVEMCERENIYPAHMELTYSNKRVCKNLAARGLIEIVSGGYNSKYNYAKIKQWQFLNISKLTNFSKTTAQG